MTWKTSSLAAIGVLACTIPTSGRAGPVWELEISEGAPRVLRPLPDGRSMPIQTLYFWQGIQARPSTNPAYRGNEFKVLHVGSDGTPATDLLGPVSNVDAHSLGTPPVVLAEGGEVDIDGIRTVSLTTGTLTPGLADLGSRGRIWRISPDGRTCVVQMKRGFAIVDLESLEVLYSEGTAEFDYPQVAFGNDGHLAISTGMSLRVGLVRDGEYVEEWRRRQGSSCMNTSLPVFDARDGNAFLHLCVDGTGALHPQVLQLDAGVWSLQDIEASSFDIVSADSKVKRAGFRNRSTGEVGIVDLERLEEGPMASVVVPGGSVGPGVFPLMSPSGRAIAFRQGRGVRVLCDDGRSEEITATQVDSHHWVIDSEGREYQLLLRSDMHRFSEEPEASTSNGWAMLWAID